MAKPLWAPWRLEYIKQAHEQTGCVFCDEAAGALDPDESLRVFLGDTALAILNKYPYSSGHLMVAPRRHLGELGELAEEETATGGAWSGPMVHVRPVDEVPERDLAHLVRRLATAN